VVLSFNGATTLVWHDARMAALLVLACAGLLAVAAYAGPVPLALAVAFVQVILVVGWFAVLDVPGGRGGTVVALLSALAADALLLTQTLRGDDVDLLPVAATLGMAFLAAFVHQIARRGGRPDVVASITATLTIATIAVLASLLLPAAGDDGSPAVVVAVVAGAALVAVTAVLRPLSWITAAAALVGAAVVGAGVGVTSDAVGLGAGAALATAAALLAVLGSTVARYATVDVADAPVEPVLRLAVPALLPVLLAAPVAYVLSRMLVL
jgi:hypothetical protein